MDTFIQILAKQNPYMDVDCQNPECKKKTQIKTEDFFCSPNGVYVLNCPHCGKSSHLEGIGEAVVELKKQFKEAGITWD